MCDWHVQEYCIDKDHFEFVMDVTKFKTQAPWGADPFKPVPAGVKSAFTRCCFRNSASASATPFSSAFPIP